MGCGTSNVFRFDLESLLQGQTKMAKLKSAYKLLINGLRGLQCETNLQEIMDWESSEKFCRVFMLFKYKYV